MPSEKVINSEMGSESSLYASFSDMNLEEPLSTIEGQRPPNHWENIIKRHAADLNYLPAPPRDFVKREQQKRKRLKKKVAYSKTSLRNLARGKEEKAPIKPKIGIRDLLRKDEQHALTKPKNTCHNWVLRPTTEKAPEPSPSIPKIIVTTPEGETCWPKDMNSYITEERVAWITERVTKEHDGVMGDLHCRTFQQMYQRGLCEEPCGHRPEILFCTKCLERQMEIEDDEKLLVPKKFRRIGKQRAMARVA